MPRVFDKLMKNIKFNGEVGRNRKIVVDDNMFIELSKYKWYSTTSGYAQRYIYVGKGVSISEFMHRRIMGAKGRNQYVDHINGNKSDNRRENLRLVSPHQSVTNVPKRNIKNPTSKYKGVSQSNSSGKWRSRIISNGKEHLLGLYMTQEDAAIAYNRAARELFGEYALLNKI